MMSSLNVMHDYQYIVERVGVYTHARNMLPPPNVQHKYQERIENVEFYTHPTNMFPPPKYLAQISGQNLKMLGFVHILEICLHHTNVWHKSWDRIENFGFYTHPINMFDDQSPICIQSIQSIQLGFSLSLKSESYSSFDIIAVCVGFYSVLEEDLCRKRQQ